MTYTAFTHQITRGTDQFAIHRTGCGAVTKMSREHASLVIGTADTLDAAIELALDPDMRDLGWNEDHLTIHACTK